MEWKTLRIATDLHRRMQQEKSRAERRREKKISALLEDPQARAFSTSFTDQVFRSSSAKRTADQLVYLLEKFGLPSFDHFRFSLFKHFAKDYPSFFVKEAKKGLKKEMKPVLLFEDSPLPDNIKLNINHLGEAILGEEEARKRLALYIHTLAHLPITALSVKVSTLFSQISAVGFEGSLAILKEKLRLLYRAAGKDKFVYLDMEEAKDVDLTCALFQEVLSEEEFSESTHGIALQSYLPQSYDILRHLTEWSKSRKAPIEVRLVKGANLAMERVESSLHGWPLPTYSQKIETDANFIRMVDFALDPRHVHLKVGVGTHNLFAIAYCLKLASEREARVRIEMLQGMNTALERVLHKRGQDMLLYCPKTSSEAFQYALAYLLRRFDENTGEENFLRHLFHLNEETFQSQAHFFEEGCKKAATLSSAKKRTQDRTALPLPKEEPFSNEPDTDFSLEANRKWIKEVLKNWQEKTFPKPLPCVIGNKEIYGDVQPGWDPSSTEAPFYSYSCANKEMLSKALDGASLWEISQEERSAILKKAAHLFRQERGNLLGALCKDSGKIAEEADVEISEAIDFIEYYRQTPHSLEPKGKVLVTPPWNFPCSIATGAIVASLIGGNAVLFKPAPETVFISWSLAQLFWQAGVPKTVLQFIPCNDEPEGTFLIQDPRVSAVVLTGATATAQKFLFLRPSLDLIAETGGKNALIITAMADRDLAISDLVKSAFGYAGQKCSASSLAILEKEVYDDPRFLAQLKDAAASLPVGSAWDPLTKVPPLIRRPEGALLHALHHLEHGESWLLEPQIDPRNPSQVSPGIKLGVKEGSFTHQTELFGPILALMRADDLSHAIACANGTPYGLTSGLHSLDPREHVLWKKNIVAGNLYINRTITGAIVRRQPFGGAKASSFGQGSKAGGPHFVLQMARLSDTFPKEQAPLPPSLIPLIASLKLEGEELSLWKAAAASYAYYAKEFKTPVDPSALLGQDNFFYLVPHARMTLRICAKDPRLAILQVVAAALCAGVPLETSSASAFSGLDVRLETEETFLERVKKGDCGRIRVLQPPSKKLLTAAAASATPVISHSPYQNGRYELLSYMREVSLSVTKHRYGYLPI